MSRIIAIILAILVIAVGVGVFLYNKPHTEVSAQKADYSMTATELFGAFEANESEANTTYLDKLIEVTGTIGEKTPNADGSINIILREADAFSGVSCSFLPKDSEVVKKMETGQSVTIKGICTGMLMDVSLARCVIVSD